MYCNTTLFGTIALPGNAGMPHSITTNASSRMPAACQNGCDV